MITEIYADQGHPGFECDFGAGSLSRLVLPAWFEAAVDDEWYGPRWLVMDDRDEAAVFALNLEKTLAARKPLADEYY